MAYLALLLSSFLAATLLPGGSEIAVVAMLKSGNDPLAILIVATCGNYLGALTNYGLGRLARSRTVGRAERPAEPGRVAAAARRLYSKLGPVSLAFSWVPLIGDPLTLVAGLAGMGVRTFSVWVIAGKAARYWVLIQAFGS
ncbi:MAG: DedA family protein [Gemmatimonadetes bacterium]|nr:DedA family protein [Gemmatimonadota bacterium]